MKKNTEKHSPDSSSVLRKSRVYEGIVVSDAMDKTIVVRVDRVRVHPIYGKRYTASSRFKVHDERNRFKKGERVRFVECRPISREKRWRVVD